MTWSIDVMVSIFDKVENILTTIGTPIIVGVLWIAVLSLLLKRQS